MSINIVKLVDSNRRECAARTDSNGVRTLHHMNSVSPAAAAHAAGKIAPAKVARPKVIQVVESFAYGTAKSVQQLSGFSESRFRRRSVLL